MPPNQVKAWDWISDSLFQLPVVTKRWQSWVNFDQNMLQWSLLARPRIISLKAFGARDKSGVEYVEVKVVQPVLGRGGTKTGRLTMLPGTWDLGMEVFKCRFLKSQGVEFPLCGGFWQWIQVLGNCLPGGYLEGGLFHKPWTYKSSSQGSLLLWILASSSVFGKLLQPFPHGGLKWTEGATGGLGHGRRYGIIDSVLHGASSPVPGTSQYTAWMNDYKMKILPVHHHLIPVAPLCSGLTGPPILWTERTSHWYFGVLPLDGLNILLPMFNCTVTLAGVIEGLVIYSSTMHSHPLVSTGDWF